MHSTPRAFEICGVAVTTGWHDSRTSSISNSEMRLAWTAAPRAASSDGFIASVRVAGADTMTCSGNEDFRLFAIRGVCDVPPERITSETSIGSRPAFETTERTNRDNAWKIFAAINSYRVRLIVAVKSIPSESDSTLKDALEPKLRAFFTASDSGVSFASDRALFRGSSAVLFFFRNSLAK